MFTSFANGLFLVSLILLVVVVLFGGVGIRGFRFRSEADIYSHPDQFGKEHLPEAAEKQYQQIRSIVRSLLFWVAIGGLLVSGILTVWSI